MESGEKIYNTMNNAGVISLVTGIILIVTGLVLGVMAIVNGAVLLAGGGEEALQNQVINWKDIPVLAASSVIFALFIFMPLYNRKREEV